MMTTYKLIKNPDNGKDCGVLRNGSDSIPFAPDNTDYQQYLAWLAEGNTPQEADDAAN
jgi:hypothetical protein